MAWKPETISVNFVAYQIHTLITPLFERQQLFLNKQNFFFILSLCFIRLHDSTQVQFALNHQKNPKILQNIEVVYPELKSSSFIQCKNIPRNMAVN